MNKIKLPENVKVDGFIIPAGTEIEIEGGAEHILAFLKKIGQPHAAFYFSESKDEWIHVTQMDTMHLKNVIAKHYADFAEKIRVRKTAKEVVAMIEDGDPAANESLIPVFKELVRRANSETR